MYNSETLLDIHARGHESLRRLLVFCGGLTGDELRRPLSGFGFPTVLAQLEHTIGAELYWQTVVEAFRQQTASATRSYLDRASETELNSPRVMISDPGQSRLLRPADVIMRVVTHIFNHQGQVLAMCRTIGKPNDTHDLDYPVD
jgi:hypothetical protein